MTKRKPKNKEALPSKSGVKKRRLKKVAKKRVSRVEKTRNHGTMTEAAFGNLLEQLSEISPVGGNLDLKR